MNMPKASRPVQQVVAADNRGCEHGSSDAGQRAVAADERAESPKPVESPQLVEALVADLEAAIRRVKTLRANAIRVKNYRVEIAARTALGALEDALPPKRSGSATGGNDAEAHALRDEKGELK